MARRLGVLVVLATLVVAFWVGPIPAGAGDSPPASAPTTLPSADGVGHIVLRPNYGHAPRGPNDRGGWQQLMVFWLLCGGVLAIAGLAWRDSRRKRRKAALAAAVPPPAAPSARPAG